MHTHIIKRKQTFMRTRETINNISIYIHIYISRIYTHIKRQHKFRNNPIINSSEITLGNSNVRSRTHTLIRNTTPFKRYYETPKRTDDVTGSTLKTPMTRCREYQKGRTGRLIQRFKK